jgi:hypothetical protein
VSHRLGELPAPQQVMPYHVGQRILLGQPGDGITSVQNSPVGL